MTDEINAGIDAFEAKYDYDMDYAREVVAVDPGLFQKFYQATELSHYDGGLPPAAHWAARTLGVIAGDCGPCVQLSVQMGEEAGVDEAIIRAVLAAEFDALPDDVRLCALFAQALLTRSDELAELRERVIERFGKPGAIAVAYGLIASYMYPTLKYAIGHGHACSPVVVGGKRVRIEKASVSPGTAA